MASASSAISLEADTTRIAGLPKAAAEYLRPCEASNDHDQLEQIGVHTIEHRSQRPQKKRFRRRSVTRNPIRGRPSEPSGVSGGNRSRKIPGISFANRAIVETVKLQVERWPAIRRLK